MLDRAAADDGVGGHALPFLLLLLQAAGEQRALFVSSLSLILSAPSQDRFDAKHFWSCQNPPFSFPNLCDDNPCCCTFAPAFSAFSVTMLSMF